MNDLIFTELQMTSLDLVEITGKQHAHIMRDIRSEIEALGDESKSGCIFAESTYLDAYQREKPCYTFGKDGAMQLALKYDAVIRRKVILKLNELEQKRFPKLSPELQAIFSIDVKQQEHGERISHLENNMTIDYGQEKNLQDVAKRVAVENIGGIESPAYANKSLRSKIFQNMWGDFKDYMNVASYRNTPKAKYQKAVEFLKSWKATGKILREIEDTNMQISMEG